MAVYRFWLRSHVNSPALFSYVSLSSYVGNNRRAVNRLVCGRRLLFMGKFKSSIEHNICLTLSELEQHQQRDLTFRHHASYI